MRSEVGEPVDIPELVRLGAERKVELKHDSVRNEARRRELRERLIARTTRSGSIDPEAAAEVREHGFSRAFDG